ncbi:type II secretion system F family protein [candidate division KSB1 bacterium]|nr:type II secretion system F family protein [candidate division KSB1 bacterium]
MQTFTYRATDKSGELTKGTLESASAHEAVLELKASGLVPIEVKLEHKIDFSLDLWKKYQPISGKDMQLFIMQLSTLLKAGMSLLISLDVIISMMQNFRFKNILSSIRTDVATGRNFSDASSKFPKVFPPVFTSVLKAGEESGKLEIILDRYSQYMEKSEKMKSELRNAMIYPSFLMVLSLGVFVFLTQVVLPNFTDIVKVSGAELPISTRYLMASADFMREYYLIIFIVLVVVTLAIIKFQRTPRGRYMFDAIGLKIPIFGKIYYKSIIARFVRTMATLLASGIPFLKNLKLASHVISNKVITKKIETTFDNISKGDRVAIQFERTKIFSPMTIQMIATGENSGSLDRMFDEIANMYDREIETAIKQLTAALEPIVLTFVASGISFIAVSLVSSVMKAVNTYK